MIWILIDYIYIVLRIRFWIRGKLQLHNGFPLYEYNINVNKSIYLKM